MAELQTPFEKAVASAPSGSPSGDGNTTGGFDLPGGAEKESANSMSGLPAQITTFGVTGGENGPGTQVDMPPVASPGTFQTE
jgi:hypothetical protein